MLGDRQYSFIPFLWLCLDDYEFCETDVKQEDKTKYFFFFVYKNSFTEFRLKSSTPAVF